MPENNDSEPEPESLRLADSPLSVHRTDDGRFMIQSDYEDIAYGLTPDQIEDLAAFAGIYPTENNDSETYTGALMKRTAKNEARDALALPGEITIGEGVTDAPRAVRRAALAAVAYHLGLEEEADMLFMGSFDAFIEVLEDEGDA